MSMKSKFKVLFMPGTHAATCDHVVIFLGGLDICLDFKLCGITHLAKATWRNLSDMAKLVRRIATANTAPLP